ncbi:MAG: cellulose binding domain-containing protein, partial [Micromonosporaceae bacterium]|nr:cellulose binding domain-containing protein [Micromonosporaceae bacterium]
MPSLKSRRRGAALAVALVAAGAVVAAMATQNASADTGASCTGAYAIGWQTPSDNPPDFGATVTVTNNSPYPITGWTITWTWPAGQSIIPGSPFSAVVTQNGTTVTATPGGSFNANLAPGASTQWGFHGTYNGTSNPAPTLTCTGPSQGSGSAVLAGPLQPLGVNTAAWDTNFVDAPIAGSLSAASVGLIRYPGGSWADQYLWQPNTVNSSVQPVNFAQFSNQVDAVTGGQKFVTIDYGSDTPASAGAWVRQAAGTSGQGVALWEIGNELYGSWETDTHANPHTPASYASNAVPYLQAMKAADPNAQICYDYAMDGALAPGAGVDNWQTWNSTILQADAQYFDCADVHWYPINGTPTETTQSIMELIDNIPAAAAEVKAALSTYDPTAYFVVGETNMSQTQNSWNEQPVGALFAAANSLEWLSFGAQSVDWWDVHNYGTGTADFGMFSSGGSGQPSVNTPFPPYYGHQLASRLAVHGARVGTLPVPTPNIYGYYSLLPDGSYAVLLANADPANGYTV